LFENPFSYIFQNETHYIDIKKELSKQEKRTIALKERFKKTKTGPGVGRRGPGKKSGFKQKK